MAKVKEYSIQIRGVSYKPTDLHDSLDVDSVVLLRANNIENDKLNLDDVVYVDRSKVSDEQYLRIGDILVCASSGSKNLVGKAAIIRGDIKATFGAFCKVIRPKEILPDYLGHYFTSPKYRNTISQSSAGANINNIRNEHIDSLDIIVPSLETQKQIAATLDKVTHTIDLCNAILEKLDLLVKARFVEMFGDIVYDDNIPKVMLSELANISSSKRIYANEYVDDGIPFYRSKEIRELGSGLKPTTELFITNERYDEIKEKYGIPKIGDILIAAIGATIGYSWIVDSDKPFYYKDGNLIILSVKDNINSIFLNHTMGIIIKEYKKQGVSGSAQLALTIEKLEKMPVVNPDITLQNQFATFVEQTDKTKSAVKQLLEKAEIMKKALMQEYFG